jgi:3-hydroxymyristoyl/3-hydroxydecanoyl-(acyl carrier protein) dehydratase
MPSASDKWLPLGDIQISALGRIETSVRLDASSSWFSGHFDERAVVPGVALLAFVAETVRRQGERQSRSLEVSGFFKVRFRKVIFPDEGLHVSVAPIPPGPEAELPFHVTCDGDSVAQGTVKVTDIRAKGPLLGKGDERTPDRAQDQNR